MYLKIMGSDNMPDHDCNKCHDIIEVSEYSVNRSAISSDGSQLPPDDISADIFIRFKHNGHDHHRRVFSNIYVMNRDGKTINTITPTSGQPQ